MRLKNTPMQTTLPPTTYSTQQTTPTVAASSATVSMQPKTKKRGVPKQLVRVLLWVCFLVPLVAMIQITRTSVRQRQVALGQAPAVFCPSETMWAFTFIPDGSQIIAVPSSIAQIRAFETATGRPLMAPKSLLRPVKLPDGSRVGIPVWSKAQIPHDYTPVQISQDGQFAVYRAGGDWLSGLQICDAQGKALRVLGHGEKIDSYLLSAHGKYLIATGPPQEGSLTVWNRSTGKKQYTLQLPKDSRGLIQATADEKSLLFAETNRDVSSGSRLCCYSLETGAVSWAQSFKEPHQRESQIRAMDLSPDGQQMAIAEPNSITIYSVKNGRLLQTIQRDNGLNDSAYVRFSPDSHMLGDVTENGIALWKMDMGK